jgi:hypothetical protein
MFADEPDQDEARQEGPDERDEQQAATIHDSTEPVRPFPAPGPAWIGASG